MKNSGIVSVGHLIENKKSRVEIVSTLRNFMKFCTLTIEDGMIDKTTAMERFEGID